MSTVPDDEVLARLKEVLADPAAKAAVRNIPTLAEAVVVLAPLLGTPNQAREGINNLRRHMENEAATLETASIRPDDNRQH